jgi:hypothetical protein
VSKVPESGFAFLSQFQGGWCLRLKRSKGQSNFVQRPELCCGKLAKSSRNIRSSEHLSRRAAIRWELSNKDEHLGMGMGFSLSRNSQRPLNVVTDLIKTVIMSNCLHPTGMKLLVRECSALLPLGSNCLCAGSNIDEFQLLLYIFFF